MVHCIIHKMNQKESSNIGAIQKNVPCTNTPKSCNHFYAIGTLCSFPFSAEPYPLTRVHYHSRKISSS